MSLVVCGVQKCVEYVKDDNVKKFRVQSKEEKTREFIMMLLHVFTGVIASVVAWNRHAKDGILVQVLVSVLAFLFGCLYLVYITTVLLLDTDSEGKNQYLDLVAKELGTN